MKQLYLMGGVVVVVAALLLAFCGVFGSIPGLPNTDPGDPDDTANVGCKCQCTIYVQDVATGKMYSGVLNTDGASIKEAMMLSFGQDIRSVQLQAVNEQTGVGGSSGTGGDIQAATSPLYKDKAYAIWAVVSFMVTGDNLKSVDRVVVESYGDAGAVSTSDTPDHVASMDDLYCSSCASAKFTKTVTGVELDHQYTVDGSAGKFNQVYSGGVKSTLTGDRVDGARLTTYVCAYATDLSGKAVSDCDSATIKFNVSSFGTGSVTVSITSISGASG